MALFDPAARAAITKLAGQFGLEPAALLAIAEVESGGQVFDGGKPLIRWEGHYFYRLLSEDHAKRQQAVDAGLASKAVGGVPNPKTQAARYALLQKAEQIDQDKALMSCSWGLGQVMGENWTALGYQSVQELVQACDTVGGQVDLMARFIKENGLIGVLKNHDWKAFTKRYNGEGGIKKGYPQKIEDAYNKYSAG